MKEIDEILTRGVSNIIPDKEKLKKALTDRKLNIYVGIDPTATHIHLGHAVFLRKLRDFADLGHNVTFLIGDFTALIGDTSDKNSERPALTKEEISKNFQDYKRQAEKILDFSKINVRHNSEWLATLTFEDIVNLTQNFTLGDFVARELIKKRMQSGGKVALHEVLYPVMQGYDSYHMDTDLQIGGTDQTFNMQAGRTLQEKLRGKESFVMTTALLMGTDGQKMSKSTGNAIWLDDTPSEIYTKAMQINDEEIREYFLLATDTPIDEIEKMNITKDPLLAKKQLAGRIVEELYGKADADRAATEFENVVQKGQLPEQIDVFEISDVRAENASVPHLVFDASTVSSISEGRRMLKQGGIEIDGRKIDDLNVQLSDESVVRVGKRSAFKIKVCKSERGGV